MKKNDLGGFFAALIVWAVIICIFGRIIKAAISNGTDETTEEETSPDATENEAPEEGVQTVAPQQ